MKLIALILSLTILTHSFAATGGSTQLRKIVDEYQYFVSVEWDQKDQKVHEKETLKLHGSLKKLIQEGKVSKSDFEAMLEEEIIDKNTRDALKLKASLVDGNDPQAVLGFLRDTSKNLYTRGASWNGKIDWSYAFPVILLTLFVAGAVYTYNNMASCLEWGPYYTECKEESIGVDEWGFTEYETTCGQTRDCLRSEKKR